MSTVENIGTRFLTWASDSSRTLEERYGILRLIEYVYDRCYRGEDKPQRNYEADRLRSEDRRYNPGYVPVLDPKLLEIAAGLLPGLTSLELDYHGDERPIRDLGVLEFLPDLEKLKLKDVEIDRLTALRFLPKLRDFHIRTDGVEDYSDLAGCRELRKIGIQTWHPWPVLTGIETLPHLESFDWLGNGRALAGLPALAACRHFRVDWAGHHSDFCNSVRDFHSLPEMPDLEYFWGGSFYRLDGIERYPKLRIVCVKGWFKSLAPLAGLQQVTHLRVTSPRITEVESAGKIRSLFQFAVKSIRPQDWCSLFETASFREVYQFECEGTQPDLGTLRMLLPPLAEIFGAPARRKLAPLRLRVRPRKDKDGNYLQECPESCAFPDGPDGWDGCPAMRQSERWWVDDQCRRALRKSGLLALQGVRFDREKLDQYHMFFTEPPAHGHRIVSIRLLRTEAIGRLRDVVECLRGALSRTRYRWQVSITVQAEADAEEWDESWRNETTHEQLMQDMIEEELEAERSRKRYRQFLQDEHRLHVLRELGNEPAPGEFQPTPPPPEVDAPRFIPAKPQQGEDKPGKSDADDDTDFSDGGLADADDDESKDESWLPPVEISDPNHEWHDLFFMATLTEDAVWCHPRNHLGALSYLLGIEPEYPAGTGPEDYEKNGG